MAGLDFLTDYDVDETPSILEIRSDKVTPINSDVANRKYIFRLEPQGVLDSNTLLQFKLFKPAGAANDELRVNCFNGALGSVKRVIFRVGDFTLNDTDSVASWSTITNLAARRRIDLNRYDAFTLGNQFHTKTSLLDDVTHGQFQVDSTLSGFDFENRTANSLKLTTEEDSCYKYGIPLGKIIPALQGREIPLYLFDQYRINIEVEFHPPSAYMNCDVATGSAVASDVDATISQVELLVDYIIYPSSVLEVQREQTQKDGGLVLDFYNVVNVQRQLVVGQGSVSVVNTAALYAANGVLQDAKTAKEFRIGQEGREIHQVYMLKKQQGKVVVGGGADDRASLMIEQRVDGIASESIAWKINGVDVYPEPVKSTASQYDQLYYTLGYKDLQVERPMFFGDANSIASGLTTSQSGLQCTYKPIGYDAKTSQGSGSILGTGTLLGKYPLVLRYECTPASTMTTYGNTDSGNAVSTDQSGNYDVDFLITTSRRAVIQSTSKGMKVSVSF